MSIRPRLSSSGALLEHRGSTGHIPRRVVSEHDLWIPHMNGAKPEDLGFFVGLLNCDLRPIYILANQLDPEKQSELARHLIDFYVSQDRISLLLMNIADHEVAATNNIHLLFREDSFNKTLLNQVLHREQSVDFLRKILLPMLKTLENTAKSKDDETSRNKKVMAAMEVFLRTISVEAGDCPPLLKQMIRTIQQAVDRKFGDTEQQDSPFGLSLLFFHWLCPAVIDPQKAGIFKKKNTPTHVFMTQVAASKVLKDIATKARRQAPNDTFVEEHHPALLSFFASVIHVEPSLSFSSAHLSPRSRRNSSLKNSAPPEQKKIFDFVQEILSKRE